MGLRHLTRGNGHCAPSRGKRGFRGPAPHQEGSVPAEVFPCKLLILKYINFRALPIKQGVQKCKLLNIGKLSGKITLKPCPLAGLERRGFRGLRHLTRGNGHCAPSERSTHQRAGRAVTFGAKREKLERRKGRGGHIWGQRPASLQDAFIFPSPSWQPHRPPLLRNLSYYNSIGKYNCP